MDRLLDEGLHPLEFLLEAGGEIVRAILEKHDETEGKKGEEQEPEKPSDERHGADANTHVRSGQRCALTP